MSAKIALGALILILVLVNGFITDKEKQLSTGRIVFLELAPVDPRSLMQGDYMALRFSLADAIPTQSATDGYVVVTLDERNVASFKAIYQQQVLVGTEALLRFRVRRGDVKFGTNAFFFQEGHADLYASARFGQFRVSGNGELLLTGLFDKDLHALGPGK